jgi:phosphoenolpyruvate carboxylase
MTLDGVQTKELASKRPLVPNDIKLPPMELEVLETFRVASGLGRNALGAYVISMASQPSDVLAVVLLQKEALLQAATGSKCGPSRACLLPMPFLRCGRVPLLLRCFLRLEVTGRC